MFAFSFIQSLHQQYIIHCCLITCIYTDTLKKAGLPTTYKFVAPCRKKKDREKLPAFTCDDCTAVSFYTFLGLYTGHRVTVLCICFVQWYSVDDIERDGKTCKHKQYYPRSSTPPGVWDISFPDSQKCKDCEHLTNLKVVITHYNFLLSKVESNYYGKVMKLQQLLIIMIGRQMYEQLQSIEYRYHSMNQVRASIKWLCRLC